MTSAATRNFINLKKLPAAFTRSREHHPQPVRRFNISFFFLLLLIFSDAFAQDVYTFYENREPVLAVADNFFADAKTRRKIPLTGIWKAKLPDGSEKEIFVPSAYDFNGKISFEKRFRLDKADDTRHIELVSYGINNSCEIYINDQFVKSHTASGTAFSVSIGNEYFKFGDENVIKIVVDSKLAIDGTFPIKPQAYDRKNYGGIFRNIFLVVQPELKIADVDFRYNVQPNLTSLDAKLRLTVKSFNLKNFIPKDDTLKIKTVTATLRIFSRRDTAFLYEKKNFYDFTPDNDRIFTKQLDFTIDKIKLWSLVSPELYFVEVKLERGTQLIDDVVIQTGFRKLELKNRQLFLNGEPIAVKGVTTIEQTPNRAIAIAQSDVAHDIALARTLGANTLRFKESPNYEWLKLADSLGFLCLVEMPLQNIPSKILQRKQFLENAENYFRELVDINKYHPCVLGYGLGSSIDVSDSANETYLSKLYTLGKELDQEAIYFNPARLQSSDLLKYSDFGAVVFQRNTLADFEKTLDESNALYKDKPVLVLEYGTSVEPNNHNGYSDRNSYEYQSKFFMDRYRLMEQKNRDTKFLIGSIAFSLTDWQMQRPLLATAANDDKYTMNTGLVTQQREKRQSFEMVKALYNGDKVYNPPIGNYERSFSPEFVIASVLLTVLLIYILNQSRRLRESLVRAAFRPFSLFSDIRDQRLGNVLDPFIIIATLSLTWASIFVSICSSAKHSDVFEFWLAHLVGSNGLKELVDYFIDVPALGIPAIGMMFFVLSLLLVALVKATLVFAERNRTTSLQILMLWMAASAHWLIFVPMAAVIDRLESKPFIYAIVWVAVAALLLSLQRLLRGLCVVTGIRQVKIHAIGITIAAVLTLGTVYLFNRSNQSLAYYEYFQSIAKSTKSQK
jgi:hypothetical protein